MSRWQGAALIGAAVLIAATAPVQAQEEERAWVRDVVVLLVGPFGGDAARVEGKSVRDILEDIRPDLAEWSDIHRAPHAEELRELPYYPPNVVGGCEYEGAPVAENASWSRWQEMFGEPWQADAEHGVGVDVHGRLIERPGAYYRWRTCHNNPRWHQYQKESILQHVRAHDADVIRQDNIGIPMGVAHPGGFCEHCQEGFRQHLQHRHTAEELAAMGIADLAEFDAAAYMLEHDHLGKPQTALDDPLVREFIYFMYLSNLRAWQDIVDAVREIDPTMPICGNQGPAAYTAYGSVVVCRPNDVVFYEHNPAWEYPRSDSVAGFKLGRAAGLHRKPVWIWDFGRDEKLSSTAGAEVFMAECYATGCVPYLITNNFVGVGGGKTEIKPPSPQTYESMAKYARFAREHRELLASPGRTPAEVALVYSIPSFMYKQSGALRFPRSSGVHLAQRQHFEGFGLALRALHIPYEVAIFGGPKDLWDDSHVPAELDRYKVLLLPNVEAVSDEQIEALRAFAAAGGKILASGKLAERDEYFAPREGGAPELPVAHLGELPTQMKEETLKGALQAVQLDPDQPRALTVTAWTKAEGVIGGTGGDYSLYLDQRFTDGTRSFGGCDPAAVGTHGWEKLEMKLEPGKALNKLMVYLLFRRNHSGTVWFDDVSVIEEGSQENSVRDAACSDPQAWEAYFEGFEWDAEVGHDAPGSLRITLVATPPQETEAFRQIAAALEEALPTPCRITTDAPPTVFVNPMRKGDELLVHLVNFDWDAAEDTMNLVGPITLDIALAQGEAAPAHATLASPDAVDAELTVTAEAGRARLTVPELTTWAIVRLKL